MLSVQQALGVVAIVGTLASVSAITPQAIAGSGNGNGNGNVGNFNGNGNSGNNNGNNNVGDNNGNGNSGDNNGNGNVGSGFGNGNAGDNSGNGNPGPGAAGAGSDNDNGNQDDALWGVRRAIVRDEADDCPPRRVELPPNMAHVRRHSASVLIGPCAHWLVWPRMPHMAR